jgi:hypothetical protein
MVELMTAVRFFAQYGQASPARVIRLALAARADSTGTGVPSSDAHERENVLSAGAGPCGYGGQGKPGAGFVAFFPHETPPPSS